MRPVLRTFRIIWACQFGLRADSSPGRENPLLSSRQSAEDRALLIWQASVFPVRHAPPIMQAEWSAEGFSQPFQAYDEGSIPFTRSNNFNGL